MFDFFCTFLSNYPLPLFLSTKIISTSARLLINHSKSFVMAFNLVDSVKGIFSGNIVSKASSLLGESEVCIQ